MSNTGNNRILIVDDSPAIHDDFIKILAPGAGSAGKLNAALADLFEEDASSRGALLTTDVAFELAHAHQGEEAYRMVGQAAEAGSPFALAFVDVRMPPGWDGIETISRIWADHPGLEMVICTAYSDYSWEKILDKLGTTDKLQFLRKPFDVVSVKQMALALTAKWDLAERDRHYVENLETEVAERTKDLKQKVTELEEAMDEIDQLRGILPMCVYCHKVRDDEDFWQQVDTYLHSHTNAEISHGICPECYETHVKPMLEEHVAQKKVVKKGA